MTLDRTFEEMLKLHGSTREEMGGKGSYSPYQSLTAAERKHLRRLLVYDLLPLALDMKEDRVTNVRLTLMKTLQSLPPDIKRLAAVSAVLQDLEDEVETWESVYGSEDARGLMMASASIGASTIPESSISDRAEQQLSSESLSETGNMTQSDDKGGQDSNGKRKMKRSSGVSSRSHTSNDPEYSSGSKIAL
jgi:hypothetical protein